MYSALRLALRRSTSTPAGLRNYAKLPAQALLFGSEREAVVAWHPETVFPYEDSLPVPEEVVAKTSVLKIGGKEIAEVFYKKRDDEVVTELAKMTYTTKHRWYPRSRDKKAKKTEPDRPYL